MDVSMFYIPLIFSEVKIPVIVVFTKYDILFNEHYRDCLRDCPHISSATDRRVEATNRANRAFSELTKDLSFPFVPVQVSQKDKKKKSTRKDEGLLIIFVTSLFPLKWLLLQE